MQLISVQSGEEVLEALTLAARQRGITSGVIVSLVGAVDSCAISNMPASDAKSEIQTEYKQPMQLTGTGEFVNGIPHIHCVLGKEGDVALCGHLLWAKVESWFVNTYVVGLESGTAGTGDQS